MSKKVRRILDVTEIVADIILLLCSIGLLVIGIKERKRREEEA